METYRFTMCTRDECFPQLRHVSTLFVENPHRLSGQPNISYIIMLFRYVKTKRLYARYLFSFYTIVCFTNNLISSSTFSLIFYSREIGRIRTRYKKKKKRTTDWKETFVICIDVVARKSIRSLTNRTRKMIFFFFFFLFFCYFIFDLHFSVIISWSFSSF